MSKPAQNRARIAFVSDAIYPYHNGGKEKRLFEITTRLALKGYEVHVYTMNWWGGKQDKKENGVFLHAICKLHNLYSGDRRSMREGVFFGLACFKLIKEDFDIVEVDHMPYFPLLSMRIVCWIKNKKMFAAWHEVWGKEYWLKYLGLLGHVGYFLEKLTSFTPDIIASISDHTTDRLKKILKFKGKIYDISLGVDISFIQSVKPSSERCDVIFVGRLLPHKNATLLVKAIKQLVPTFPNISCIINGDGPERNKIKNLITEYGLEKHIKMSESMSTEQLYAHIKSAKVLVLPSIREGFGIVVIEAMACGIPVITTNYEDNAARYLIEEGKDGFLCKPTIDSIASRIELALDSNGSNEMKSGCLESVQKYDWSFIVNKMEKAYLG